MEENKMEVGGQNADAAGIAPRVPIQLLSQETIDLIAAGEVIERPASVVKELVENAIDAGAGAISVSVKGGGIREIRVTDDGCGIPSPEIRTAFLRHATSKLRAISELEAIHSLGFRGEALSSISAAARVEVFTRTADELVGTHLVMEGKEEVLFEESGLPAGSTFLVTGLFQALPARRKFLKAAGTEGAACAELCQRLALSHPGISFRFQSDGRQAFFTPGNGSLLDAVSAVYGHGLCRDLISVDFHLPHARVGGFLGSPNQTRGNRNLESFFVNGRFIHSRSLSRAIEEGYEGYVMSRRFPFALLFLDVDEGYVDVNVHPAKDQVRFLEEASLAESLTREVAAALRRHAGAALSAAQGGCVLAATQTEGAEPFETSRLEAMRASLSAQTAADSGYAAKIYSSSEQEDPQSAGEPAAVFNRMPEDGLTRQDTESSLQIKPFTFSGKDPRDVSAPLAFEAAGQKKGEMDGSPEAEEQLSFLSPEAVSQHRLIGSYLDTYWLVEFQQNLYMIDQHAAHEKVLYERTMARLSDQKPAVQQLAVPVVLELSPLETETLSRYLDTFCELGFDLEEFGGRSFVLCAVPADFSSVDPQALFMELLASCQRERMPAESRLIRERVASMSCKAAVKGRMHLSEREARALIEELLSLDNPWHCPHGRPTVIVMTPGEIERRFKRIV